MMKLSASEARPSGRASHRTKPLLTRGLLSHYPMNKINLAQKLSLFDDHFNPRIVGELNGQYLKLVKFKGPFTWHHHDHEDELFLVVKGRFRMEYRDASNQEQSIWIEEGEMISMPRGVEHRPVADEEAQVLLFEPASTLNTGNVENEFTKKNLSEI